MNKDKITLWSLAGNAVLAVVAILLLLRSGGCKHAEPCTEVRRTSDTIIRYTERTDTMYRTLTAYVPRVERVVVHSSDTLRMAAQANLHAGTDTVLYSDSIYLAREFKAIINDVITGNRIAQRSIRWADLTPITDRTVTNTTVIEKQPVLVKVYLGADAGVRYTVPLARGGLDIAPSASIVIADRYMLDAGYYIAGGQITAGVKVKLAFRK